MIKQIILVLISILLLYSPVRAASLNYDYIAGKLIGEGADISQDMFLMACTVKNRLERGWNPKYVMRPYYASYVQPTKEDVAFVTDVIENGDCPPVYFFYSESLVKYKTEQPIIESYGNWYYSYEQYQKLWK